MSSDKYWILDGHTPVPTDDVRLWGAMFEKADRIVAVDQVGAYRVSTVFLGMDHNWYDAGLPLLFETMIFTDHKTDLEGYTLRYSTWEEAENGHAVVVYALANEIEVLE